MSKNAFVQRPGRRSAALLSVAAMATTGLIAAAGPAGAVITQGPGGNDATTGAPLVFQDDQGVAVQLCLDEALCAEAAEPVDPEDPPAEEEPVFPAADSEAMYFGAEATAGPFLAIYAIEAVVDAAGAVEVFNVARFRARDLTPNATYTIQGPYGTVRATADGNGRVEHLIETGPAAGHVTTMLRRTDAPAGFLGDFAAAPGPVTGSPTGFNRVVVRGPNGAVVGRTNQFAVAGQMAADTAMTSVDTAPLRMGNLRKSTPTVRNIAVSNFGTADAAVTVTKGGANPGAFAVTNNCAVVAQNGACNITVTYAPRANRDVSAILTIDDNGLAAPRQVALTAVAHDTRAPRLQALTPGRAAKNVRPGKNVRVAFSEAVRGVNRRSFVLVDRSTNRKVAAKVSRVRKSNRYVLNPRRALKRDTTYTVRLNGGRTAIRDRANNGVRDMGWRFRTR